MVYIYIQVILLAAVIAYLLKLVTQFCEYYLQRVPEIREHPEKPDLPQQQTSEDELDQAYKRVYSEPTPVAVSLKNMWEVYHKLKAQENLSKSYEYFKNTWLSQNLKVPEGLTKDYEHLKKMLEIPTSMVGLTDTGFKESEHINKMWELLDSNVLKILSEKCTIQQFIDDNTLVMIPDNAGNDEFVVLRQPSEEVDTIEEENEGSTNTRPQVVYKDVVVFRVNHGKVSAFLELCSPETIDEEIEELSVEHFKNQICSEGDYRLFSDSFPELKEAFLELRSLETIEQNNEEPSIEHFKNQICSEGDLPFSDSLQKLIEEFPELHIPETSSEELSIEHFKNQICSEGVLPFSDSFPKLKEAFLELRIPETIPEENEELRIEKSNLLRG